MRGEDRGHVGLADKNMGSPPHARGRLKSRCPPLCIGGITPACAGKTSMKRLHVEKSGDHPRMRGEDRDWLVCCNGSFGSPPHARGRPKCRIFQRSQPRITPACAGKTRFAPSREVRWRDHPRMRGEDYNNNSASMQNAGSPPHARGRPSNLDIFIHVRRITPACAGKTRP